MSRDVHTHVHMFTLPRAQGCWDGSVWHRMSLCAVGSPPWKFGGVLDIHKGMIAGLRGVSML